MRPVLWMLLTPRERKFILRICGLVLLYAVVGFLILPPIVRRVATKQISRQLDREVSIESVSMNPFVLSATVCGVLIKDKDGEPFVSWDEVHVNFQLSSCFGKAWVFKEISASKLYVHVQLNKDYTFNFSDLLTKFSTNAAAASRGPGKPLALRVDRLHIGGAVAALTDYAPRETFKRRLGPLDLTLENFRTDPDNPNSYSFYSITDAGETLSGNGNFCLAPLRIQGELKLFNFTLNKYAPLYQDLLRFQIRDGTIALALKYRMDLGATNRVTAVDDLAFALRDFKLGLPGSSTNFVEVPLFSLTGASVDLQKHTATADWVSLADAKTWLNRSANRTVNLVELSKPAATATNATRGVLFLVHSVTNAVAALLNTTNEWSGTVRNIAATNCAVYLKDFANARPAKLDLSDITLDAKNLSNLAGTNFTADFSLRWNTNGSIKTAATASFLPTTANVKVDLDHLDLTTLDAYLADQLDLLIIGCEVNLHGTVRLRPQVNELPVVSFLGNASLEHVFTTDSAFGEDLVKWDALRVNGVVANLNPPLVAIREIAMDSAYARVIVQTNRTVNLLNVLRLGNVAAVATNVNPAAVAENKTATNSPIQISIGAIVFTNTTLNFSDRSISPNVNLVLQSVNGGVSGLSTEERQHAVVELGAQMDGASRVTIAGTINPLNGTQTNNFRISVKDVDLTPTSPYGGKFAGYRIAEGKLNLDLEYLLVGKKLTSKNVITLDRFAFGEKVESQDATHLPVRLAIAILKDRDGKIVLDVPIEGSIDDPKFRVGKVVGRAIVNILEKVATSPFSLLGALVGGDGEDLGWQDFAPGSAALTADGMKKLDALAKALDARPALKLEIAGSIDPAGDREGLQREALDREIRTRKWQKLRKSEQATNSVAQLMLSPEDRARYVKKLYGEALATKKITPELLAANTNLAAYAAKVLPRKLSASNGKGAALLGRATIGTQTKPDAATKPVTKLVPPPDPMEALLLATFPVSDTDLETLAADRAGAVRTYLLETRKVHASRIFLTASRAEKIRRDGSRAYLQLR